MSLSRSTTTEAGVEMFRYLKLATVSSTTEALISSTYITCQNPDTRYVYSGIMTRSSSCPSERDVAKVIILSGNSNARDARVSGHYVLLKC